MLLSPPPPPTSVPHGGSHEPEREPRPGLGTESRIWLVRHGRVSAPTTAYGDDDVPLSEEGQAETQRVGASAGGDLNPVIVIASPLIRARAMGEAIAESAAVSLELDPRLKEMNRGDWQGLERTEYAARWLRASEAYWADTLHWHGHGGESEAMLAERTYPVLQAAALAAAGGTGVIAAHRQVIRSIVAAALGLPPGASHGMQLDPAHAVLLADTGDRWTLLRTNVPSLGAPHLTEPDSGPPEDVPTRKP